VPSPTEQARVHEDAANRELSEGYLDQAIAEATHAIQLDPNSAQAYVFRAEAYRRLRQLDRSLADVTRAVELDPGLFYAHMHRAVLHEALGMFDPAIADATRAV